MTTLARPYLSGDLASSTTVEHSLDLVKKFPRNRLIVFRLVIEVSEDTGIKLPSALAEFFSKDFVSPDWPIILAAGGGIDLHCYGLPLAEFDLDSDDKIVYKAISANGRVFIQLYAHSYSTR